VRITSMRSGTRSRSPTSPNGAVPRPSTPTLNIPVFISTDIDKLDDTSGNRFVFGVCNATPGVVTVISKIKARQYDDPNLGAQVYQYDIWRSPFSNIQQTSGKNLA